MPHRSGATPHLAWPRDTPGHEEWYTLITHQDRPVAFWCRYTLLATPSDREARLWAGLTDRDNPERTTLHSERYDLDDAAVGDDPLVRIGDAALTHDHANGTVDSDALLQWAYDVTPDDTTFTPLRSDGLTAVADRVLGTGRYWSYSQDCTVDGTVTYGDHAYDLSDAPAQQGHIAGTDMADRWTWTHCTADDVTVEALNVEGRTALCLRDDEAVYRLNRLHHVAGPLANRTLLNAPGRWSVRGAGDGADIRLTVDVPDDAQYLRAAYTAPDDTQRYVAHSGLSDITIRYRTDREDWRTVEADTARAEWGATTPPIGDAADYTPQH